MFAGKHREILRALLLQDRLHTKSHTPTMQTARAISRPGSMLKPQLND